MRVFAFLKRELLEMLPPTLFFLLVFQVVVLVRRLLAEEAGLYLTTSATAVVGALILGKSILVADALPLFRFFRSERLIYNVVWRTLLYLAVALAFQLAEELIPLASKYGGLGAALGNLARETDWTRFWVTHAVLALFLSFYAFTTALIGVIGVRRFLRVFFGWRGDEGAAATP